MFAIKKLLAITSLLVCRSIRQSSGQDRGTLLCLRNDDFMPSTATVQEISFVISG